MRKPLILFNIWDVAITTLREIVAITNLLVTIDMEAGYGSDAKQVGLSIIRAVQSDAARISHGHGPWAAVMAALEKQARAVSHSRKTM